MYLNAHTHSLLPRCLDELLHECLGVELACMQFGGGGGGI